jgi:hypothetical protein
MKLSQDRLPDAQAALRQAKAELAGARKALSDAETADPVRDLEVTSEAARQAL